MRKAIQSARWILVGTTVVVGGMGSLGACSSDPTSPATTPTTTTTATSTSTTQPTTTTTAPPPDPVCASPRTVCKGNCTDTLKDVDNCGACDTKCGTGEVCSQGKCAASCGGTSIKCSVGGKDTCVNATSDNENCGACGTKCGSGYMCSAGKCALSCTTGYSTCLTPGVKPAGDGGADGSTDAASSDAGSDAMMSDAGPPVAPYCANLKEDPANCGGCGAAFRCGVGQQCLSGLCCAGNELACNNACTNVQKDANNCGACGTVCGVNAPICASGKCIKFPVVGTVGGVDFFRVPVAGTMSDANIFATCTAAGLVPPCAGQPGCTFNNAKCKVVPTDNSCGNPMWELSKTICGGTTYPSGCPALNRTYQYMGDNWVSGSSCGVENAGWCTQGNSFSDRDTLCIAP